MNKTRTITALNAVVADTTSSTFYVGGASRIAILLRMADYSAGSAAFTIKASLDEMGTVTPTMTALNIWIDNVINDITHHLTRVNGKTLSADGDAFLFLDPAVSINWVNVAVNWDTDGTDSAWIICEYED